VFKGLWEEGAWIKFADKQTIGQLMFAVGTVGNCFDSALLSPA
jgi:hypothetical protein